MAYAVGAFVILQVAQLLADGLNLPSWVFRAVTFVSLIGFPVALLLAWALEVTPEGIKRTQDPTPGELAANSVRRDGNQVRVSAQLVDAAMGFSIWRGNYERDMVDLYALQNEIAGKIVNALAVELGASNADQLSVGGSENGEAYELYVRARQRWATRNRGSSWFLRLPTR